MRAIALALLLLMLPSAVLGVGGELLSCLAGSQNCDSEFECLWGNSSCKRGHLWGKQSANPHRWLKLWDQTVTWNQSFEVTAPPADCTLEVGTGLGTTVVEETGGLLDCHETVTSTHGAQCLDTLATGIGTNVITNRGWAVDFECYRHVYIEFDFRFETAASGAQSITGYGSTISGQSQFPWIQIVEVGAGTDQLNFFCAWAVSDRWTGWARSTWLTIQMDLDRRKGATQNFRGYLESGVGGELWNGSCSSLAPNRVGGNSVGVFNASGATDLAIDNITISNRPIPAP